MGNPVSTQRVCPRASWDARQIDGCNSLSPALVSVIMAAFGTVFLYSIAHGLCSTLYRPLPLIIRTSAPYRWWRSRYRRLTAS